jgi:peptide/nickel transport system substrate-binding protein
MEKRTARSGRNVLISLALVLTIGFLTATYATPAHSKKLIVVVGQEPTSMDPSLINVGGDFPVVENWGEYLIYKATSGDLGPGLATSWKMSPDGKEIEFTLRKGVKFHSGDLLTAKDVAFSFERLRTKNPLGKTRLKSMERFEVIDDYHFKIYLKVPDVTFIPNRGNAAIVSKSYYDRVGEDEFMKHPVGTGPYKFVRHVPGEYVDIERFEDYWGKKPSVEEARFLFVPEGSTRVAKLKAGEADIIADCPYPMVKDIQKYPGLKIIKFSPFQPTISVNFATRNTNTPWHDKRVRLAIAYAIDCDAIVNNVLQGIPDRWVFLAPHELGYDPDLKRYPYNPQKARELLAEAGYPQGFDLKLYWPITGRYPMAREVAEVIAAYLETVRIRTKLIGQEWAAFMQGARAAKAAGAEAEYVSIFPTPRSGGPDPTYFLQLAFSSDGMFSVYYNPEVDKIIAEARTIVNDTKRGELIKKAVKIIHEDVASIPIFTMVAVYAMKANIDFKPTQKHHHDLLLVKDVTIK